MLSRFDPFREMTSLRRDIERLFDESLFREVMALPESRTATHLREWPSTDFPEVATMPMDIYEEGNHLMVKASVPGLKPEEIKIEVRGDVLHIFGETKTEEEKERNYHLKEHRFARYERSVVLPSEVNPEKAHAVFDNGMLTLTLPKTETVKAMQIPIKTMAKA